ncbi:uncharacterized protein LOC62_03G004316 [Vanrija pseudolonga]|uniref:Uncharacterized protein n=1 Tax=Vanrija pseudolonga TaxID=143232 RepID=A0AAF1BH85_9TREE|nr:hypothetical protein LOC62_03G004316 [Vanrija pseudolonga]
MPAEKDPWKRSLFSPSPVPSYFSDDEDLPRDGAFISLAAESDLANELDLSRREDRAIVTKTPFTLATLRAKKTAGGKTRSKSEESNRIGNIKTAEDALKPSKPTPEKAAKAAPKKDAWKNSTAWSDPSGRAILPTNKPRKKAADAGGTGGKGKGKKATAADESTSASSSKTKGKAASDKIQFRRLRKDIHQECEPLTIPAADLAPTSDFPIVAGFERQKALPKKTPKPPAAKVKPKAQQTKLNFSSKPPVDVNALVVGLNGGAAKLKPTARKPIRVYSSSSDGSSSSAFSIGKVISTLPLDDEDGVVVPSTLSRTQHTPPLTRSHSTPSPEELYPAAGPATPAPRLRRDPTASKAPDIALLEAMAEKGDMGPKSGSMFSQLMPSRPEVSYGEWVLVFLN